MRLAALAAVLAVAGCEETAWNTTIADDAFRRSAMAASVVPGRTTETAFITRWGAPVQRVREGGQTELVYRNMSNPPGYFAPRFGDSGHYVIVTFQYGRAVAVRTSETEGCRATFPPAPPGPGFANPTTVHPAATCPGVGALQGRDRHGARATETGKTGPPGVPEDRYSGAGKWR